MVVTPEAPRKRKIQAWYICALLHYQGKVNEKEVWCVALLRRHATTEGLHNKWEFIEGLDFDAAKDMLDNVKPRLVRCTPGDLKKVVRGIEDE